MPEPVTTTPWREPRYFPPPRFDPTRPNAARVWNALMPGMDKDTFDADREVAQDLAEHCPNLHGLALTHRAHHAALVTQAVQIHGVMSFAELGSGYPYPYEVSTQQTALKAADDETMTPRVLAVDRDLTATLHLAARGGTGYLAADIRDTDTVLAACSDHLGSDPRAYLFTAVAEFLSDEDLAAIFTALVDGSPGGSVVCLSHVDDVAETAALAHLWGEMVPASTLCPRTPERLAALLRAGGAANVQRFGSDALILPGGVLPGRVYGMLAIC